MFEPISLKPSPIQLPGVQGNSGRGAAIAQSVLSYLDKNKKTPPGGGDPSASYAGSPGAFDEGNMAVHPQSGPFDDSPAPSQAQDVNHFDDNSELQNQMQAEVDKVPKFTMGDSTGAFDPPSMNNRFGMDVGLKKTNFGGGRDFATGILKSYLMGGA